MKRILLIISLVLVVILTSIGYFLYENFYSMSHLPLGKEIYRSTSPEGNYKLKIYLVQGGLTTDSSIRGEIMNDKNQSRNIYWSYHESKAKVQWINDTTVSINGHILNVLHDTYDWRRK